MEQNPTKEFLYRNGIKQIELARYLGVTKTTVSRYVTGTLAIPLRNVTSILRNPYGWDTSMFGCGQTTTITSKASGNATSTITIGEGNKCKDDSTYVNLEALLRENEMLRKQLEEEKKRSAEYWAMIISLTKR